MKSPQISWKGYRFLLLLALFIVATTSANAAPQKPQQNPTAPTYTILATREGLVGRRTANGHIIQPRDHFVALPSWSALSPNGSHQYQVRITYRGRTTVAPVWDVGPWNTRDDYWSVNRRYSDLPVGMPMAQAAYLHGYNGGYDELGRRIRSPNGIDIADGTFWDDLGMTRSDWVQVTFLWLGEDPGPQGSIETSSQSAVEAPEGSVAIDHGGPGHTANEAIWYDDNCGFGGSHAWTYSTTNPAASENHAAWSPDLPTAGFYEIQAYIPFCGRAAATTAARYRITHDGAVTEVNVNQQTTSGTWASLGVYHFGGESQPLVELSDVAGDDMRAVRFDAIAWVPRQDTAPPTATITAIVREGSGYRIQWDGEDDLSGIASYDIQVRRVDQDGWTNWKQGVAETSAWFGPDEGKHFAFRIRARDWAGHEQSWPEHANATTCVTASHQPPECMP